MTWKVDACAVAVDVDGRQRYLFETDKLKEVLGASMLIGETVKQARASERVRLLQPVSGEIRLWSALEHRNELLAAAWALREWLDDNGIEHSVSYLETDRRHFETTREPGTPPYLPRSSDENPEVPSLSWVQRELTARISRWKAAKPGADARPTCSLLAPCLLHAGDVANQCNTVRDANEPRRDQRGYRATCKHAKWHDSRRSFYETTLQGPFERLMEANGIRVESAVALRFSDLADQMDGTSPATAQQRDQFVAFICADGDEVGRLLTHIDWNWPGWNDGRLPWERNRDFVRSLERVVREAYVAGILGVAPIPSTEELASRSKQVLEIRLPLLAQLLGGDDQWTVARRDVAFPFCIMFAEAFAALSAEDSTIRRAIAVANEGRSSDELAIVLTMSLGVAFAKAGYPAHAMIEAAESLLKRAKRHRKTLAKAACVDWHWIESSRSETIEEARASGWQHHSTADGLPARMQLTTRPWTISLAKGFLAALEHFVMLPRRKREQLEIILRQDYWPSLLQWEAWWKGLTSKQRTALDAARQTLADHGLILDSAAPPFEGAISFSPWRTIPPAPSDGPSVGQMFDTPWLDLLSLQEVVKPRAVAPPTKETRRASH